jgi:type IV pilus assembly protein PilB
MSDLPSIDDLTAQSKDDSGGSTSEPGGPVLQVASDEMKTKFFKKMGKVNLKQKETETMHFAQSIGYPHIDLEKFPISYEAMKQVPADTAKKLKAVCFLVTADELRVGAMDPQAEGIKELIGELGKRTHSNTSVYVISQKSLDRVLEMYKTMPVVKPLTKDVEIRAADLEKVEVGINDLKSLQTLLGSASTTDSVVSILGAAFKLDASDVHIEAEADGIVVRMRLDGMLHDAATLQKDVYKQLVSRIKLVSSLKINITDKPQDGRFTIKLKSGDVDVRVSAIPTIYGESIVMRLLHQSREGLTLEKLGLSEDAFATLKREIERPNGMIITTGPTGSGKTTTLYAVMNILNQPDVKIITLEDPVEYKMEGINQSQIDADKGYTFAKGLRSMLRQDPDVVMVGEIRDLETAEISVQAALTGHLMLSTLHTNNAAGAIPRFLSMGVKAFLLAPSLNCVIGQRLVRKVCTKCKEEVKLDEAQMKRVHEAISKMPDKYKQEIEAGEQKFFTGKGCQACGGIGFKGRIGIYEIFVINSDIEKSILGGEASQYAVEELTREAGMMTMVQDGIVKALKGITSISEVFRVIE